MKFIGWVSWTLMDIYIIAAMVKFLQGARPAKVHRADHGFGPFITHTKHTW